MKKQAILIMYHNDYYILEKLLQQIDCECFDIYLHVDKKVRDFDFEYTKKLVNISNLYFTKRMNVGWSTFSQIQCELLILKEAVKKKYSYYHLLSGVDMLLKKPLEIYNYFEINKGMEFIAYQDIDKIDDSHLDRIKYYHILNKNRRHKNKFIRIISTKIYYKLIALEKKIGVNRLRNKSLDIRKGANWFSITYDLAKYVLSKEREIYKLYKYSNCADELFLQTLTYNSKFRDKIYLKYDDEHKNIKRYIDWNKGQPYTYKISDYDDIMNSDCFFARKFSSNVDKDIIDKIFINTKD